MSAHSELSTTPYKPRRTEFLGVQARAGWRVKVIGITAAGDLPGHAETEAALVAAESTLPQPAFAEGRCGIGFVIVHRGAEALWVLVCWWELDILHHRVMRAPLGTTDLQAVPADTLTACVWELLAIDHERHAWVTHVLQRPDLPDLDAYLADAFGGSATNHHKTQLDRDGDASGSMPDPPQPGQGGPALSPAEVFPVFSDHLRSGNVDGIMALYEPGAAYVSAAGKQIRDSQIRDNFLRLTTLQPRISGELASVIVTGDIALVGNRWNFSGQRADGVPLRSNGISAVVMRRRGDGGWGILIDDPRAQDSKREPQE